MRVAFFVPSFRGGGAERVVVRLATELAAAGLAADVLVAQREGPNLPPPQAGLRVIDLRARRVLAALPGLARYLREQAPAAMLSALPHANVVAVWARALARSRTRIVVSEHSIASLAAATAERMRGRVLPFFMRRAYPRADAVVAVSDGVAADLVRLLGLPRERITRIYNPVASPALLRLAEAPLEDPWFAPGAPPVVLAAGRLVPVKDFTCLLRAFAQVRAARPARLVILGEGAERPALERLAGELGISADFALPGFVDNPWQYMRRAAVFVMSSRFEGLGNTLVEAMACGTPVASTDCHGPREVLEGGRHGPLVPVGDATALAAAILRQLEAGRAAAAPERAAAFDVATAVAGYRAVLQV